MNGPKRVLTPAEGDRAQDEEADPVERPGAPAAMHPDREERRGREEDDGEDARGPVADAHRDDGGDERHPRRVADRGRARHSLATSARGLLARLGLGLGGKLVGDLDQEARERRHRAGVIRIERERAGDLAHRLDARGASGGARLGGDVERATRGGRVLFGELATAAGVAIPVEVALDRDGDLARRGEALVAIEGGGADADRVELRRDVALGCARARPRVGAALELRDEERADSRARMKRLEREDLEEDRAERINVGPRVERADFAAHLLRRDVSGRAHHLPAHRLSARRRHIVDRLGVDADVIGARDLGEAPIEDVNLAEVAEHHVRRA